MIYTPIATLRQLAAVSLRRMIYAGTAVAMLGPAASAGPPSQPNETLPTVHDFDFLQGRWAVHNWLLRKNENHSSQWVQFDASDVFHELPGSMGSEENFTTEHWPGFVALGLHLFDPVARRWMLYWADNRHSAGTLQLLATGGFAGNTGIFYGADTIDNRPIKVRITWIRENSNHVRWEQAFSNDHGQSWETNWIMQFTRR